MFISLKVICELLVCSALACSVLSAQQPAEEKKPAEPDKPPSGELLHPLGTDAGATAPVDPKSYVIGPEDVVLIHVWHEQELSGAHSVRPDGKITLPLVGDVVAGGVTPEILKDRVTQAISEIVKAPQVSVFIRQVNSKKYYITGEARRTGPFPLITPITVFEALSNAGGLGEFAKKKKIVVWRKGQRINFNYKEVAAGKNLEQNIYLEPGDHIIVP
jgi:polysaccharide export outer membrane protein